MLGVTQAADGKPASEAAGARQAGSPDLSSVSLRSADLIVPKSPGSALEDGMWAMSSLNLPTEWGSRAFDVLGSQPSWTFAVGQGMEAVH